MTWKNVRQRLSARLAKKQGDGKFKSRLQSASTLGSSPSDDYLGSEEEQSEELALLDNIQQCKQDPIDTISEETDTESMRSSDERDFNHELTRRRIYNERYPPKQPHNLADIQRAIKSQRQSPSPTHQDWVNHCRRVGNSKNEDNVKSTLFSFVELTHRPPAGHAVTENQTWDDHVPVGGYTSVRPKPDYAEGLDIEEVPAWVYDELEGYAAPAGKDGPVFVNFTLEAKGPHASMRIAHHQNRHNGATCVNGYQEYDRVVRQDPGHSLDIARVGSAEYNGSIFIGNIHWVSKSADGSKLDYHMMRVLTHDTRGFDLESFATARREARNFIDFFQTEREELRRHIDQCRSPAASPLHYQRAQRSRTTGSVNSTNSSHSTSFSLSTKRKAPARSRKGTAKRQRR